MVVKIVSDLYDETLKSERKLNLQVASLDAIIDGELYTLTASVSTGSVISAEIFHGDLDEEQLNLLSGWWYGVNFADEDYENFVEFTLPLNTKPDYEVEYFELKKEYDIVVEYAKELEQKAENLHDKVVEILLKNHSVPKPPSNTMRFNDPKYNKLPF